MKKHLKWAMLLGLGLMFSTQTSANEDEFAAIKEKLEVCTGCHAEKGASKKSEFPILAGQELYYIYVQLKDFKSGFRKSEQMGPIVEDLTKKEMLVMAKYYSEQKWPRISFEPEPSRSLKGETAANAGQCTACHLGAYNGNSRVPRLAGQFPEYLKKTMLDFKNKVRNNSPAKGSLMNSYKDDDIAAMAEFLGGLTIR